MTTALQLFLLPSDRDAAVVRLRVDTHGRVLGRDLIEHPLLPGTDGSRRILVVPGADCRVLWLDLPARNALQAVAAARLLAADHVAAAMETQHVAVAPPAADDAERLVVCVETGRMREWLDRAAALGIVPDAMVPAPLLLPEPADVATVTMAEYEAQWLVRGAGLAFAADPVLASHVIGDRARDLAADSDAILAAGAPVPPIDLLQHAFARAPARRDGWAAWRRAAFLGGTLAVSPLLVLAAQAIHHARAAGALEMQARALASTALPSLAATDAPLPALQARLADLHAGDAFARTTPALLGAVAAAGAGLDSLSFNGDTLVATVVHDSPAELARVRDDLAGAGIAVAETGSRHASDGLHSTIELRLNP
jgi:general secretion pathway protein L